MRRAALLVTIMLIGSPAPAFDMDGFQSGMPFADVIKHARDRYGAVENGVDFFIASQPKSADDKTEAMQFWFCDQRLIMLTSKTKGDLSVRALMSAANDEIIERGQPLQIQTRASLHGGIGELRELILIWHTRPDYFNVTFEYVEKQPGLISHSWFAENKCMRPHWMRDIPGGSGEAGAPRALPAVGG